MNRMITNVLPVALALVAAFGTPALAQGEAEFEANYGRAFRTMRASQEGASGLALFVGNRKPMTASSSWEEIKGRALPDWQTIVFPNGKAYILPSVCYKGNDLHVIGKAYDEVCVRENGEGACVQMQRVALVISRDYTVNRCTRQEVRPRVNTGELPEYLPAETVCTAWETVAGRHELSYLVNVKTAPTRNGEDSDPNSGKLLFQKEYAIQACR